MSKIGPERKFVEELRRTGFGKEDVWDDFKRHFPKRDRSYFASLWWSIEQAAVGLQKNSEPRTLTKDKAWNDVMAIVEELQATRKRVADLQLECNHKDQRIKNLTEELNHKKKVETETLQYRLAVQRGEIKEPKIESS